MGRHEVGHGLDIHDSSETLITGTLVGQGNTRKEALGDIPFVNVDEVQVQLVKWYLILKIIPEVQNYLLIVTNT